MCKHCEGELETYIDPDYEKAGITIRAYLSCSQRDGSNAWEMTISNGDSAVEVGVDNCPWCGRNLD